MYHTVGLDVANLAWTDDLQVRHFVLDATIMQVVQTAHLFRVHSHNQLKTSASN